MKPQFPLILKPMLLLFLAGSLGVGPARGDIRLLGGANGANNGPICGIDYSTSLGLAGLTEQEGTVVTYEPDDQPGHQFFAAACTALQASSSGTADNQQGLLRAHADSFDATSQMYVDFHDEITFFNQGSEPVPITVSWNISGTLHTAPTALSPMSGGANFTCQFNFGSGDVPGGSFVSNGSVNNDGSPANNYRNDSISDWSAPGVSAEVVPNGGGFYGATFTGHTFVPPGQSLTFVAGILSVLSQGADSVADFEDTAAFQLEVPAGVSFTSAGGLLSEGSRLLNISTRADVLSGDSVTIAGFIVTGEDAKQVIVRGIGPSLADLGVSGALSDTTLELHHTDEMGNDEILAENDNWQDTQESEIEETGIPPNDPLESAIVRTLDSGFYTAILRGKDGATGVGLIEVYDLESSLNSRLANISTRAFVESGDNVLIGGFIGGGNGSQPKVLIRAIGPSLTDAGVADALEDPVLELHDAQGALVTTNDDWESDQKDEIEATGIPPTDPKESAILATLLPTNYTAIVRGANDTTGVALVEVYHLQ